MFGLAIILQLRDTIAKLIFDFTANHNLYTRVLTHTHTIYIFFRLFRVWGIAYDKKYFNAKTPAIVCHKNLYCLDTSMLFIVETKTLLSFTLICVRRHGLLVFLGFLLRNEEIIKLSFIVVILLHGTY